MPQKILSSVRHKIGASARRVIFLVLILASIALGSTAIEILTAPLLRETYSRNTAFRPGIHFGHQLFVHMNSGDASQGCLVIGASNSREGFDVGLMSSLSGISPFSNAATTGGNSLVLETQAQILKSLAQTHHCIIVGVTPWMLYKNDPPNVRSEDYLAHLPVSSLFALSSGPLSVVEGVRMAFVLALPLRRHSTHLNRYARVKLFELSPSIGQEDLEYFPGELTAPPQYRYAGLEPILDSRGPQLREQYADYYIADRYEDQGLIQGSVDAIATLADLTDRLIVVITPETDILTTASDAAMPSFSKVLAGISDFAEVLDCRLGFGDHLFHDEGHLNALGREALSLIVAERLAGLVVMGVSDCGT